MLRSGRDRLAFATTASVTPMTSATTDSAPPLLRRATQATIMAGGVAAVVNVAIYGVAKGMGADLIVPESPGSDAVEELAVPSVLMSSIVPILVAGLLAVVLRRFATGRASTIFTIVVAIGFVGSFMPFLTSDFSAGTAVALFLMHPVVAGAALHYVRPLTES